MVTRPAVAAREPLQTGPDGDAPPREAVDLEARLAELDLRLAERDAELEALNHALRQRDMLLQQVGVSAVLSNHRLLHAQSTLAWRLARPLRLIRRLLERWRGRVNVKLIAFNHLEADGVEWVATGDDPQFLLLADRDWHVLSGWHWLEIESVSPAPLKAQLYFDLGEGFDSAQALDFRLHGSGVQRIPLRIRALCRAIRLDPCAEPGRFRLAVRGLVHSPKAPVLPPEFHTQAGAYQVPSRWACDLNSLEPTRGVLRQDEDGYEWRAEGADPWFVLKDVVSELRPGWYRIEARIHSDAGRSNAKLYFDYGQGYAEAGAVTLPFHDREEVKRLYYLPALPRQVRFDPLERPARFAIERLTFTTVRPMHVRNAMLRRLCQHYVHYKDQSIALVWRDLQAQVATEGAAMDLLYRRYNETFAANAPHDRVSYAQWIARVEAAEFSDAALDRARASFKRRPSVSVVMPVYNTAEDFLRRAIESVLAQSYPHWELCVADDASSEPHVRRVLEDYARRDPRIKVVFRTENGHISAASNSGLAIASGEYVALLDHDDELARHALHFVVQAINRQPSAQILYSDEDKIDGDGVRSEPHFKPDWNPDLFLSQNYVSHLGVYRRDLLERIGGFRAGVEGSQDQDLLLRCLSHVAPGAIVHIPNVLYHWRAASGSTALASGEKYYAVDAGIKALADFFAAQGRHDVQVEAGLAPNTYRVRYPIPQPEPLVSLLVPTRDSVTLLAACVRSILDKTTYGNLEILIIDNGSVEPATLDYFGRIQAQDARVRVLTYPHPFNFSAINNFGVRAARGVVVGLVNNDIQVISPEWLTEMASHALRPEIGCVGAKLYYDDETIQHAGVIVGLGGVAGHSHKYLPRAASGYFHRLKIVQNLSAVTGACLVVRKAVYEEVGGLEENGLGIAFNDVDFCLKLRKAGYRNLWTPYAELYHYESKSRGLEDTPDKVERFNREIEFMQEKWGEMLRRDPCYSPNLTLAREDFSLG